MNKFIFKPSVSWHDTDFWIEPYADGRDEYGMSRTDYGLKKGPKIVTIDGVDVNGKLYVYVGTTTLPLSRYIQSANIKKHIRFISSVSAKVHIRVAYEEDVTNNDGLLLPSGLFAHDHTRRAIVEKETVEHMVDGHKIVPVIKPPTRTIVTSRGFNPAVFTAQLAQEFHR